MQYHEKSNSIIVHIPRTGGGSRGKIIDNHVQNLGMAHDYLKDFKKKNYKIFNSCKNICAFIRNPWDWELSRYWQARKKLIERKPKTKPKSTAWYPYLADEVTFDEYCVWRKDNYILQSEWICDEGDKLLTNWLGRFENLKNDWEAFCKKIGLPFEELPLSGNTNHKHYTEAYSNKSKKIIGEIHAKDIEMFNYEFGG